MERNTFASFVIMCAEKAQAKDFKKVYDYTIRVHHRQTSDEWANSPTADSYNRRDARRVEKILNRMADRIEMFGLDQNIFAGLEKSIEAAIA